VVVDGVQLPPLTQIEIRGVAFDWMLLDGVAVQELPVAVRLEAPFFSVIVVVNGAVVVEETVDDENVCFAEMLDAPVSFAIE
jgi:hypothetical protein